MTTKTHTSNPFLEKTIENWLTTTNELSYQMPFCQLLLSKGYTVCHNSKQNAFEQGKDIIAINKSGVPCGFQLKGGNITNRRWRDEVKDEIEELIDYQIVHPSISKSKGHLSFLVTNGELEDTVRVGIDNLNTGKWKENPLEVITGGELLSKFVDISNNFTPQEVTAYKSFLDLYFRDGKELINEKEYSNFITEVLRLNKDGLSKEERKRNIASAVLYTGYIISSAKKSKNHITTIQTLSLLCAHILGLAEKYSLEERYWLDSFEIIWGEIEITAQNLQDEIGNDELEKLVTSMWDGELGQYRRHIAIGYLLAFKCAQLIDGNNKWDDIFNDVFFTKLKDSVVPWGEGGFFPIILLSLLLDRTPTLPGVDAFKSVCVIIEFLIKFNGAESDEGVLSPYYGITTAIERKFGLLKEPLDENFARRSFTMKAIIDLLIRHKRRADVEEYWRDITYIEQEEFLPKETWMHFLWRSKKGKNESNFPVQTQSWSVLEKEAQNINLKNIPRTLQKQKRFLPFFLLLYPHRVTTNYIKFLDKTISESTTD